MKKADVVGLIIRQIKREGIPAPVLEYYFHPFRKWKFDFAYIDIKCAIEFEGGIWLKKSGHNTGTGIARDIDKYNAAALMGWKVFRIYGDMVYKGKREMPDAMQLFRAILGNFKAGDS